MDIQQLRNFIMVAKLGSITKAAEALYVSQPNLSMNIKRLETEIGAQLLDRSKKKMTLTVAGKIFLECSEQALQALNSGIEQIHALYDKPEQTVTISAREGSWIMPLVEGICNGYPNLAIRSMVLNEDDIISALLKGQVAFAISENHLCPEFLEWKKIYTEHLGVLVNCRHPFAKMTSVELEDLKDVPFVLNIHHYPSEYLKSICEKANFVPRILCECNENPILGPMIESNFGVSLVDMGAREVFATRNATAPVTLVPICNGTVTRELGVLYPKNEELPITTDEIARLFSGYFSNANYMGSSNKTEKPLES